MDEQHKRDVLHRFRTKVRQLRAEMEGFNLAGGGLNVAETTEALLHVEEYLAAQMEGCRDE